MIGLKLDQENSHHASSKKVLSKTKTEVTRAQKRITLPIEMEKYSEIVDGCQAYRKWLDEMIIKHPELGKIHESGSLISSGGYLAYNK
jgi:hypothetical protein